MKRMVYGLVLALILMMVPAYAQTPTQQANNVISYGEVGTNVLLQTLKTLNAPNKSCATKQQAFAVAFAVGVSEVLKNVVSKRRPDGSDFKSFPSEHTAIAAATSGWNFYYGTSIALGTGASRVYANKHDKEDVLAGYAIGAGGQQLGRWLFRCDPNKAA